jgi:quercetin 2,3-dioxygenase
MIKTIRSIESFHEDFGWLNTHWHFSFDGYHDPSHIHWSALRVSNDDVIEAG